MPLQARLALQAALPADLSLHLDERLLWTDPSLSLAPGLSPLPKHLRLHVAHASPPRPPDVQKLWVALARSWQVAQTGRGESMFKLKL